MADIVIILVLTAALTVVIRYFRKQKATGCSGNCLSCSGCDFGTGSAVSAGKGMEEKDGGKK